MKEIIAIEDILALGKNINQIVEELYMLSKKHDLYIKAFDLTITSENRDMVFKTLNFIVAVNTLKISEIRRESAKTRKKGEVGRKRALDDKQELELIKSILEDGCTRLEASDKFYVSPMTVSRILKKHNIVLKSGRRNK